MYRNHLDGRIANKVTAFMTKEHAEATRGDMVSAIQSGTGEIFRKMTCYMKTIPGSDAFLLDMKHQAVAVYRSLLLMEQRTPILFSTTSAAEQYSLFTQLGLELLSNPPVGHEGPPCLLDADAGGDWARRFQRTSVDPVAVQMLTYEQLFSLRRLRHAYFCVDDFVTGNEEQGRGAEHEHDNQWFGGGVGAPRGSAMLDTSCRNTTRYYRTGRGRAHMYEYLRGKIGTARRPRGMTEEAWSTRSAAYKAAAYKDPRDHPAGMIPHQVPDRFERSAREADVNDSQQLLNVHRCHKKRCLVRCRHRAIKNPKARVFILGTPAEVKALVDACDTFGRLQLLVGIAVMDLVPNAKKRHAKIHKMAVSKVNELHLDATPTVYDAVFDKGFVLVGRGGAVKFMKLTCKELRQATRRFKCKRYHPLPPLKRMRIARSMRKKVGSVHKLVIKYPRSSGLGAMQNPQLIFQGRARGDEAGGCHPLERRLLTYRHDCAVNGDDQWMIAGDSGILYSLKYPLKDNKFGKTQTETMMATLTPKTVTISVMMFILERKRWPMGLTTTVMTS